MSDCPFCQIVKKEIPAKIIFEDEEVLAFEDIAPQAPVHILIIPKEHFPTVLELKEDLAAKMLKVINNLAKEKGLSERGFRVVINCRESAGQAVFHVHFHLLAGREMNWPPG